MFSNEYPNFKELQFCLCNFFQMETVSHKLNQAINTLNPCRQKILKGHINYITKMLPVHIITEILVHVLKWWNANTRYTCRYLVIKTNWKNVLLYLQLTFWGQGWFALAVLFCYSCGSWDAGRKRTFWSSRSLNGFGQWGEKASAIQSAWLCCFVSLLK